MGHIIRFTRRAILLSKAGTEPNLSTLPDYKTLNQVSIHTFMDSLQETYLQEIY